ncbi:DUF2948 family protein [Sandaracinobacteroides hominis]|uniref:DUF2948 family protein n=1 Tax=Sandaracinobacteroides hominis TaxID=2780086 RepID=UPI0018F734BE|nr:DUF2948 family protein [Sandaracinobacteroides hominis]
MGTERAVTELLLLRAEDEQDLRILSACVQDMAVKAGDISWSARHRQLVLVGNRLRWEAVSEGKPATRVRSALRFDFISRVQRKEWPDEREMVLPLMAIEPVDGALELIFGGGARLRLEAEVIDITLEDMSGPWGAISLPQHDLP